MHQHCAILPSTFHDSYRGRSYCLDLAVADALQDGPTMDAEAPCHRCLLPWWIVSFTIPQSS